MAQDNSVSGTVVRSAPTINSDRCVHGLSPIAQCQACVAACPSAAFALEEEGLTFDPEACDSCGLCLASCPEQAIDVSGTGEPLVAPPRDPDRAFMACAAVVDIGEPGSVSCLHALSSARLARLHGRGIRMLMTSQADCRTCSRGKATSLAARVADLNLLLEERELPLISVHRRGIADWREERDEAASMSRRSLFRAAFARGTGHAATALAAGGHANECDVVAPDAILAAADRATSATFSPHIAPAACDACNACVEVCPHGVITLQDEYDRDSRYEVDATLCTGCRLCVDTCEAGALTLERHGPARPPVVSLVSGRCRVCASPFHRVEEPGADTAVCRICATKPHGQKLFQVLP